MFRSMGAYSAHARHWATEHALPLWAGAGYDDRQSLFVEKLDLRGRTIVDAPRRLTVQARQVYVYAHAALLGWYPEGRTLALRTTRAMIDCYGMSGGGWAFAVDPHGKPVDIEMARSANGEAYALAFALFALAWAYRLQPDPLFIEQRDRTLSYLDARLAHPAGGYRPSAGSDGAAVFQNPHMHLLEAMLAWWEATHDVRFLARSEAIVALFQSRFFQARVGMLAENFDAAWAPVATASGLTCEPGHHYEWTWLLHRFAEARGEPVDPRAEALYLRAVATGQVNGRVVDEVGEGGIVARSSSRCWPQTEAIKAHAVRYEAGDSEASARALGTATALFESYLNGPVPGGWTDQVDAAGAPLSEWMPATTLYHLFLAIAEAHRVWPPT